MALDHRGRVVADGDAFDDVGIKRALREELRRADFFRGALEFLDEDAPDDLAFALGIGDALERLEKTRPRR
jgi:hypothetical protein